MTAAKSINETSWQEIALQAFTDILSKHRIPIDKKVSEALNQKLNEMNIEGKITADAKAALVKSAQLDNAANEVIVNLGIAAMAEGNMEDAKKCFAVATEDAAYNMGLANLAEGNYAEAAKALNETNNKILTYCLVNGSQICHYKVFSFLFLNTFYNLLY